MRGRRGPHPGLSYSSTHPLLPCTPSPPTPTTPTTPGGLSIDSSIQTSGNPSERPTQEPRTHLALARPGLQTTTCPYHKLIPLTASRDTHLSPHPTATGQICPSTTHTHPSVPHSQQPDYVQLPQSPTMPRTPHHQPQPNYQVIPVGRTTFDPPPSWVFSGLR